MRHLQQRNSSAALMMALTRAPDEADRRPPIMVPTPDMMFEGAKGGGKTNLMLECLKSADELNCASNKGPTEIVEVMSQWEYDIRHPPQSKPRSKRGQRVRRWR